MHNTLSKLLQKRGIESYDELTPEEKVQFDEWNKTLAKDELTIDDFRQFCHRQIAVIGRRFEDLKLDSREQDKLVGQYAVYSAMLQAIDAPKAEREQVEKFLLDTLKE